MIYINIIIMLLLREENEHKRNKLYSFIMKINDN